MHQLWPLISTFLITLCFLTPSLYALPDAIRIGGLFHPGDDQPEIAFRNAIDKVNKDQAILPRSKLIAVVEKIAPQDSFGASKRVCNILSNGVAAIFGPQSSQTASLVQSICATKGIPHIETRCDYESNENSILHNLYPHSSALSQAYVDIVKALEWKSFTIVYETNDGLVRSQELLKAYRSPEYRISVRQFGKSQDYRPLLKTIKNSADLNIVLDCATENISEFFKQAQQIGIMTDSYSYLITSLDLHTLELDEFKYSGTNLTGIQLFDPEDTHVENIVDKWTIDETDFGLGTQRINARITTNLKTESALIYDAVNTFAKVLHAVNEIEPIDIKPLTCNDNDTDTFPYGPRIVQNLKFSLMTGLTNDLKFDYHGDRTDFELKILELNQLGLQNIGTWHLNRGVKFTRKYIEPDSKLESLLPVKTIIVTGILNPPYWMLKESPDNRIGNDRFEGYGIDLIHEMSQLLNFNYTFQLTVDGRHGSMKKTTGKWDGMIQEILEGRADLAIGDLTITFEREQVVDFSLPFMNLGISILYQKPTKTRPDLFSFLSPLSFEVWLYMGAAYLGVSILLFFLARVSPYESDNMQDAVSENPFSLLNSFWFTIACFLQQGCETSPNAISTRLVSCMWWFFALIMVSSYTANLAAFLTVERMESPIANVEDLAKQTDIKYGAVLGGSTCSFLSDSDYSTYQRMWSFMESQQPSVFTSSNMDGVDRVLREKGGYAFLMESTSIEYMIERNCDLAQVGGLIDSKGYGIAMRRHSPLRSVINGAILKLQETGKLHLLKNRWWHEKRGGGLCSDATTKISSATSELSLANVGGVFLVLICGMGVGIVIAVFEFFWKVRKIRR